MLFDNSHLPDAIHWVPHLLQWYDTHKRDFPWRRKISVYQTWICEVMSQQTTMAVVVPRFEKFIEVLPTLETLANCSDEILRELWSGLGYYARARNLRRGAAYILSEYQGKFPTDFESWLKVPGVGPYTASVITSICFGETKACVDGNVIRVLARLTGCSSPMIWSERGKTEIQVLAHQSLSRERPGDFNQAMMELGATRCQKQSPACLECPVSHVCMAYKTSQTHLCPPPKPRKAFENVALHALRVLLVPEKNGLDESVLLVRRNKSFLSDTVGFPLFPADDWKTLERWLTKNTSVQSLRIGSAVVSHTITHHQLSVSIVDVALQAFEQVQQDFVEQLLTWFPQHFDSVHWVSKSCTSQRVASSLDRKIWENISLF